MFDWFKSIRAISVILFVIGIHAALFTNKVGSEFYGQVAMLVVGAYFAKRDSDQQRGGE